MLQKTATTSAAIFSNLELPEGEKQSFYEHMGHSDKTNQENYQFLPALRELLAVGKHQFDIDASSKTYYIKLLLLSFNTHADKQNFSSSIHNCYFY